MFTTRQWMHAAVVICLMGWVCSGPANGANPAGQTASDPGQTDAVQISKFDTVQLNVQDTDLNSVLQLLSVQSHRNIVPSTKVEGKVTANLYDVTFHEALDAILQQNGCGYVEKGNFIFVYTQQELQQIQQAERRVTHRVFRLNYITATDASTFITPLLSSAGSIAVSGNVTAGFQPTIGDAGADSFSDTHTMIVRDYPEYLDEVAKVIEQLDVRPKQVLVEATILQADITEENAFGVDFSILTNLAIDTFTKPLGAIGETLTGATPTPGADKWGGVTSTVGTTETGKAGVRVGIVTNNIAAFIRALDSVTDTTILANPKVMVVNRQRAEVLVGQRLGYLSTTATSTATTQTVEFLDVGTKLTVRPFVSDDGVIRLELKPSVSEGTTREVAGGAGAPAVTIPDEVTQELTTNVMVRDGQTVVLGGLFRESTTITRNQVPGLGDLPVIGNAFKGHDDTVERDEVIFLITPHIVKDASLEMAGKAARDGVELIRFGAREHLLPWSRTKLTATHLRDALQYIEQQNREMAMWEVDLALGLEPRHVDALRLKERLAGSRPYVGMPSLLEGAVDLMVEQQTGRRRRVTTDVPIKPDSSPASPSVHPMPILPADSAADEKGTAILDVQPSAEVAQSEQAEPVVADAETVGADAEEATDSSVTETVETTGADGSDEMAQTQTTDTPGAVADEPAASASTVKVEPTSGVDSQVSVPANQPQTETKAEGSAGKSWIGEHIMPPVLRDAINEYQAKTNGAEAEDDVQTASVPTE